MPDRLLALPDLVRQKAAQLGATGARWLEDLPDLVAELESEWDVVVGRPLSGGSESYVAEATTPDGLKAVLRLQLPDPSAYGGTSFETTAWIFSAASGHSYARQLRHDARRRALLLERLGPSL